jgi:pheromone shutdown protein TraB
MTAHLTKQLGMAPGGEFRTAFREAQKVPGCNVVLGDRPVGITLKRAINSLSTWKKIRLAWSLLTSKDKITNEDVEKCMEQDMLEKLLLEMSDEYPDKFQLKQIKLVLFQQQLLVLLELVMYKVLLNNGINHHLMIFNI